MRALSMPIIIRLFGGSYEAWAENCPGRCNPSDYRYRSSCGEGARAARISRRNGWLAHLDPNTIADPNALATRAKLTFPDLERGFKDTEEIVLKMSSLYEGTIGELKYIGGDDYEVALYWIRRAKCAFIEKYEHEVKKKWDGPRPKDCSRNDWELL
jgi:hypothetical protein